MSSYAVVIPATGRHGLARLLTTLDAGDGPPPTEILIVDDRRRPRSSLDLPETRVLVRTLRSDGRGPVAARNLGWRSADAEWIVFVGDDVLLPAAWPTRLAADLAGLPEDVVVSQGAVRVPLPTERRPTDWERTVAGRARTHRTGADMAYRRSALVEARGFDERFRRAHRADEDVVLRLRAAGLRAARGDREATRPVGPAGLRAVLAAQSGRADDALMRRVHGPYWRERTNAPGGDFARHLWTCGAVVCAAATLAAASRSPVAGRLAAAASALVWTGLTAGDALARIGRGPRTPDEMLRVLAGSAVVPPVAVAHRLRGEIRVRRARPPLPAAVLFDRDGTLIDQIRRGNGVVGGNGVTGAAGAGGGDEMAGADGSAGADGTDGETCVDSVVAARGAREALARLRRLGVPIGVLTSRPSVNGSALEPGEDAKVNDRVEALLGPFDVWEACPHAPDEACACRRPQPGLIRRAAASLGVAPEECVVIGDVVGDVVAARAAGARAILVPTPRTRADEVAESAEVAADLVTAVELAVDGKRP